MKTIRQAIIGAVALSFASAVHSFAIEGLQISVQSSNVVLSWPSTNTETYLVQYRPTLDTNSSWMTLTDYFPAATGTNVTFFVHSNSVQYLLVQGGGTNGGGGGSPPVPEEMSGATSDSAATTTAEPSVPMVKPVSGSGDAVPMAIYPPGFDLYGFLVYYPSTGEWMSGNGYMVPASSATQASDVQPMDGSETNSDPNTGFYRVVRDGAHLVGITNGMTLSGIITIPIEVANGFGILSTVSLTENDSPVGNSIQTAPFNSPLALTVDTTQMSNGVHQISASARWDTPGGTNEESGGGLAEADSPPISVTISNEISFPNWMPEFGELGNSLLIRATSAHTNVGWYIDVYDSHYSYIGTLGGTTPDGDITVAWNLVGPDGVAHTNDNFFIFYITTPFSDPPTQPIYKRLEQWSGHGAWVAVAQHAWDTFYGSDELYAELNGFIGGAQNVGWSVLPNPDGSTGDAYALNYGSSNPQGDSNWQAFRNALYDSRSRNLVYFGHGGPDGLGFNSADTNRYIPANEIANMLYTIPVGQTNRHSFRFVFLDGCSTAKGTLPEAFGMLHRENVAGQDYADASLRYSAFVGWPTDAGIGTGINNGLVDFYHVSFITHIQQFLLSGETIKQAIADAAAQPDIGGEFNADSLKVYGFWGLTFALDN